VSPQPSIAARLSRWTATLLAALILGSGAAAQERVTLNFSNTEIEAVVRAISQFTGKAFIVDPRVKGTLTLTIEQPLSPEQAMAALSAALRLQGVVMVESTREIADKIERETRFYITSLTWLACRLGPVIRSHWAIENSLHWVMDMVFRDDECRVRTDHAPANFTTLKHMAHNLIRKAPGRDSLRLKRKVAAWDDDFLASLLAA